MFPIFQVTYAHELMNDAHEYEMQVQLGKNNTRVLQLATQLATPLDPSDNAKLDHSSGTR